MAAVLPAQPEPIMTTLRMGKNQGNTGHVIKRAAVRSFRLAPIRLNLAVERQPRDPPAVHFPTNLSHGHNRFDGIQRSRASSIGFTMCSGSWRRHVRINSNTNCLIFLLASLSLTAGAGSGGRQRLQLIGERNLSTLIREPPGAEPHSHSIADLKISDDDRWIAIDLVAGHYEVPPHGTQHHHLLLVPADLKTDTAQQFDFEYQPQTGSRFFLSADAGIVVIADGAAVRVEDRRDHSSCSVLLSPGDSPGLYLGGFINAELFLVTLYSPVHRAPPNGSARYELYDRNCKLQDSWDLPGGMPATASPEAGHILLLRYFGGTQYETDLVEWPSWKVVNRWPFWQRGLAADKGRVLCFESFAGNRNSPVQCRDLANGTVLAKQVVVHDGDPLAVARSGKLAVGND